LGLAGIFLVSIDDVFAQQSPEDCGPNQVYKKGLCLDIDADSSGAFSTLSSTGGSLGKLSGDYKIKAQYGAQKPNQVPSPPSIPQPEPEPEPRSEPEPEPIPDEIDVDVRTSKTEYVEGDLIIILGEVSFVLEHIPMSVVILGPNGNIIFLDQAEVSGSGSFTSTTDSTGAGFKNEGTYLVQVNYADFTAETSFEFIKEPEPVPEPPPPGVDQIPPELLMPADIVITGNDPDGTVITYSVKAIDNFDQILTPTCDPQSGSIFPLGVTVVRCTATDSSGNTDKDSFKVLVEFSEFVVPKWVKDVAGFWCNDEIDDSSFVQAIQYLITSEVLIVPPTESGEDDAEESEEIPAWIKNNACWWSQGLITDGDFVNGIQFLIENGIIQV